MIKVKITQEIYDAAKAEADSIPKLRRSITRRSGLLPGLIAEYAAAKAIGAKKANTYDFDLLLGPTTIDVKSRRCLREPKLTDVVSIYTVNVKQRCKKYLFVKVRADLKVAWVLGIIDKFEFFRKAKFYRKGQKDPVSKRKIKADCFILPIALLEPIGV